MPCKLLLADDHQLMLAAIHLALDGASDLEIVAETQNGSRVLPLVGRTSPDVVLLDLRMPGMDGLRCLELLRERYPQVKAIVLSAVDDPAAVKASLARGAVAFVHKSIDPDDLAAVIRQAIAGNIVFSAVDCAPVAAAEPAWELTAREIEILGALAEGRTNKQMAQQFWLSDQTVKYHLTHIYRKLGVNCRTEALHLAYEHGLVEHLSCA